MELTLKIDNKKMFDSFVQFFNSLGIRIISFTNTRKSKTKSNQTFFDNTFEKYQEENNSNLNSNNGLDIVFGIWKGRDITLEKIRHQQWAKKIN